MPNLNQPFGLRAVKHLNGSPFNGQTNTYAVKVNTAANGVFVGDAVKLATGSDPNGVPYVVPVTAATDTIVGVCVGRSVPSPNVVSTGLAAKGLAANEAGYILVVDAPDVVYEMQENGTSNVANVNKNASLVGFAAGSAVTGVSGMQLDTSTVAVTSTLQLHILGYVQRPDNDVASPNGKVLVQLNKVQYATAAQTGV